jgi:ribosomal protein S12 methylthiotransferase accessory factor
LAANPEHLDIDLSCEPGKSLLMAVEAAAGPVIARGATLLQRLFLLRSPWAPGLRFVGGEAIPSDLVPLSDTNTVLGLAGSGTTIEDAFAACVGEGLERLSQFEQAGDVVQIAPWRDMARELLPSLTASLEDQAISGVAQNTSLEWVEGRSLDQDQRILVPADWCLRRDAQNIKLAPRTALSTGAAAGTSYESAASRALLELVERHAAFLWWEAGRQGAPVPLEWPAIRDAVQLLGDLRQSSRERVTWLIDLTTELGIPSVAAVSFNGDGKGFACGTAARLTLAEAASAAIREMCQMELGLLLATIKLREAGPATLNETDLSHLDRGQKIDARDCVLVQPTGRPIKHTDHSPGSDLAEIRSIFANHGIEASLVDLTRDQLGLPTVHALAPGLCPLPACTPNSTTRAALTRYGAGTQWTTDIPLS